MREMVVQVASSIGDIREIARQANELLRAIGRVKRLRQQQESRLAERIQALKDRSGPSISQLRTQEEQMVNELVELVVPKFALLAFQETKTIKLRNGTISLRTSPESLEMGDTETRIMQRIAKHGGLTRFTRIGQRTLDKEALKRDPAFVAKIKGLSIVRKNSLIIRPAKAQGPEIVRSTDTLSVPLSEEV